MLQPLLQGFGDLLFPRNCLLCKTYINASHSRICQHCLSQFQINHAPFCPNPTFPTSIDMVWSCYHYNDIMKRAIHHLKFYNKTSVRHLAQDLIELYLYHYQVDLTQFDLIIPIPLHPVRQRERGYNQARLIAEPLSQKYVIPLGNNILARHKNTYAQTTLSQKDRWTNLTGAFKIQITSLVEGKRILLIDDLLTTGATASHAAERLKHAGATTVGLLTLAIA